ncbi:GNAT family N-acetyltransferase [Methylobacterium sp. NFXW15]
MISATIQSADRADAAAIASLHAKSWRDAYRSILNPDFLAGPIEDDRLALWSNRLADPAPSLIVETARGPDHQLFGFIAVFRGHDPRWGSWVDNLHVTPEMRGQKIGERLLRSVAQNLASQGTDNGLYLWVFEANQAGLRFYQRLGGEVVEHDTSRIPAASGKTILRVHWRTLSALA